MTSKHKKNANDNNITIPHVCEVCSKEYKFHSGLWKHKKMCKKATEESLIVLSVMKQNNELIEIIKEQHLSMQQQQKQLLELIPHVGNKNITNNNVSLNVFLNETCKDAMNLNEFVDSLKIQLSDLDKIGNCGFATGISEIIVKELKAIDLHKRPLHCSDLKREIIYIREKDNWEKESDRRKIQDMINTVANRNIQLIPEWKKAHPGCNDSASIISDQYNRIILGALDNTEDNNHKIIKKIAKEVKI